MITGQLSSMEFRSLRFPWYYIHHCRSSRAILYTIAECPLALAPVSYVLKPCAPIKMTFLQASKSLVMQLATNS